MQLKIHEVLRFIIGAAILALYIFGMVQFNWLDPIIKWSKVCAYLVVIVLGAVCAGVLYGLLPTKKTVRTTAIAFNSEGKKDRVVGYWLWLLCGVILFVIWLPIYINEM